MHLRLDLTFEVPSYKMLQAFQQQQEMCRAESLLEMYAKAVPAGVGCDVLGGVG